MTSSEVSTSGAKHKRPPSFPHVHPDRAKKFKQAWVEKAKIRSKWKAQKEKEGIVEKSKLDIPVYDDEEGDDSREERRAGPSDTLEDDPDARHRKPQPRTKGQSVPGQHRSRQKEKTFEQDSPSHPAKTRRTTQDIDQKPSDDNVRELMREAYSKSSLHTFKADPLKKRGSTKNPTWVKGEKGKGQPNMKLRMNAMLAKIKKDYT